MFPTVCSSQSKFITDDDMGAETNFTWVINLIVFDQISFLLIEAEVPFDLILVTHYLKKKKIFMMYIKLKLIYSEKAKKICEVSTLLLFYVVPVKIKVEISQNIVTFSEYMNFTAVFLQVFRFT